ncbi:hypothetical protein F2Q69_00031660 [Brassica cretica]|uniref:Uncharacterized protein n=1 Tax=Brassica cretica TaxID=69181 RepID=A0A8S9S5Z6_BRACR|nr:hypothetical protein F2Q69_00031660 [Brassica cretica]
MHGAPVPARARLDLGVKARRAVWLLLAGSVLRVLQVAIGGGRAVLFQIRRPVYSGCCCGSEAGRRRCGNELSWCHFRVSTVSVFGFVEVLNATVGYSGDNSGNPGIRGNEENLTSQWSFSKVENGYRFVGILKSDRWNVPGLVGGRNRFCNTLTWVILFESCL